MPRLLNPSQTAASLPYPLLAQEISDLLLDDEVQVPPRLVQALPGGGSLFVMPAFDARVAITKLISFTPANAGSGRPTIQGDVVVFDVVSGSRVLLLDGPTVTARRTAAVSVLAAQRLAPQCSGPLLIVGAGAQGRSHLEAFTQCLGVREVLIASGRSESAQALVDHAKTLGLNARTVTDANSAMSDCPLVVTCTPANGVVLQAQPRSDAFIAAVGSFTPKMVELSPALCQHIARYGSVVVDTSEARHEAGDLIQAGLDVVDFDTLKQVLGRPLSASKPGPVLFKSCGWAGWDLAAARTSLKHCGTDL
ncbi:MAG: delta(1)-pyrroline-2-carboxylate reductase family protein [Burkholderiaceae bacterium]